MHSFWLWHKHTDAGYALQRYLLTRSVSATSWERRKRMNRWENTSKIECMRSKMKKPMMTVEAEARWVIWWGTASLPLRVVGWSDDFPSKKELHCCFCWCQPILSVSPFEHPWCTCIQVDRRWNAKEREMSEKLSLDDGQTAATCWRWRRCSMLPSYSRWYARR